MDKKRKFMDKMKILKEEGGGVGMEGFPPPKISEKNFLLLNFS